MEAQGTSAWLESWGLTFLTSGARFLVVILKEGLEDNSHDEDTVLMGS